MMGCLWFRTFCGGAEVVLFGFWLRLRFVYYAPCAIFLDCSCRAIAVGLGLGYIVICWSLGLGGGVDFCVWCN